MRECKGCKPVIVLIEDMRIIKGLFVYLISPSLVTIVAGVVLLLCGVHIK
jgi:hypothetical protein